MLLFEVNILYFINSIKKHKIRNPLKSLEFKAFSKMVCFAFTNHIGKTLL